MYSWQYFDDSGNDAGTSERFADQDEAERWMGEAWAELREGGVEAVELIDQDRGKSFYRMSLSEAEQ